VLDFNGSSLIMADDDIGANQLFNGEFILHQAEVIFFKKKKKSKKKKQPSRQRAILLITKSDVGLNDPTKNDKTLIKFARDLIVDHRHNPNLDGANLYKLELDVNVAGKIYTLFIEFPSATAHQDRFNFIQLFDSDTKSNAAKQPQNTSSSSIPAANGPNGHVASVDTNGSTQSAAPNVPSQSQNTKPHGDSIPTPSPSTSSRRGVKRKHQGMDEETLRKRACKLAKHKYLATLYKTLVGKKVLTAAEFWDEYGKDIDVRQSSRGLVTGMSNTVLNKTMERDNMWSLYQLFSDDIAQQQAQNEEDPSSEPKKLRINLTAEHILEIFIHLPEVKLAYEQNVPLRFDEKEFWTMFLQSHYFKRKRKKDVTSSISEKETEMDKLLRKYTLDLQAQSGVARRGGAAERAQGAKSGGEGVNSFGAQIERIQRAKNDEVDVAGKLKRMREEVAAAREAAQNGTGNGDMTRFVQQIESGDINVNGGSAGAVAMEVDSTENGKDGKDGDGDVAMKGNGKGAEDRIEENKPLKRRNLKKKLKVLDPAIDLTATMESFTEIIDDPGNETTKNMSRSEVQSWFSQVNKHGTMLLFQSLNQRKGGGDGKEMEVQEAMSNVPKVSYGRKGGAMQVDGEEGERDEVEMKEKEKEQRADNLKVMEMQYEDRLNVETAFEDLQEDDAKQYIELNIKDQSVYWGDNLLMNEKDLNQMKQVAGRLHDYFGLVAKQRPKLANVGAAKVSSIVSGNEVLKTIDSNTTNNTSNMKSDSASRRVVENRRSKSGKTEKLMIYAQNKELKVHARIIQQLPDFQRPMTELVRHYWGCFPANHSRINKAKIIVENLQNYRNTLVKFQTTLGKKKQMEQRILLQELVNLVDAVFAHFKTVQTELQRKEEHRKQHMNGSK